MQEKKPRGMIEIDRIITVTDLNLYIKGMLEQDILLSHITVKGEISNFKNHSSGHLYMSLKDKGGVIRAVMFRMSAAKLKFIPYNGMQVIASGRVSVYERDGQYQLYISDMIPDGVGALYVAYEQLKERLASEGLFDEAHKKPIPKYPNTVGIVTSPTGAAIRDILNILKRRFPYTTVYLYPALVQGEGAKESIVKGLKFFDGKVDVVITGRGGGSIEDLWAFNEEIVARTIYEMKTPVISAVGHETDFTIADFVADRRVPTPSAAAEIAVPSASELMRFLKIVDGRLCAALVSKTEKSRKSLENLTAREVLKNPAAMYNIKRMEADALSMRLETSYLGIIGAVKEKFIGNVSKLDAMSPLKILGRGYLVARDENGIPVSSVKTLKKGDLLKIDFKDGNADCEIKDLKKSVKNERKKSNG